LRRAARLAKGWYGFALDLEKTRACLEGLKQACAAVGRRFEDVEVSITPPPERERPVLDVEAAKRFAELGVRRLILYQPRARDEAAVLRVVEQAAHDLVGKVAGEGSAAVAYPVRDSRRRPSTGRPRGTPVVACCAAPCRVGASS